MSYLEIKPTTQKNFNIYEQPVKSPRISIRTTPPLSKPGHTNRLSQKLHRLQTLCHKQITIETSTKKLSLSVVLYDPRSNARALYQFFRFLSTRLAHRTDIKMADDSMSTKKIPDPVSETALPVTTTEHVEETPAPLPLTIAKIAYPVAEIASIGREEEQIWKKSRSFTEFEDALSKTIPKLNEQFTEEFFRTREAIANCPECQKETLYQSMQSAFFKAHSSLTLTIQSKSLECAKKDLYKSTSREEILTALTALHIIKATLKSSVSLSQLSTHLDMYDEYISALNSRLSSLPQEPATTNTQSETLSRNTLLSNNSLTIGGVALPSIASAGLSLAAQAGMTLGTAYMINNLGIPFSYSLLLPTILPIVTQTALPAYQQAASFLDRQCKRLPETWQTPMQYAWRITAGASAAGLYLWWSAPRVIKDITPTQISSQEIPQPIVPTVETSPFGPNTPNSTSVSTPIYNAPSVQLESASWWNSATGWFSSLGEDISAQIEQTNAAIHQEGGGPNVVREFIETATEVAPYVLAGGVAVGTMVLPGTAASAGLSHLLQTTAGIRT